nr:tripartite tricarboxylate transporter TctB family protein [uncultured Cohaesibacter sp.]
MNYKISEISLSIVLLIGAAFFWFSIKDIPAGAQMFPNFILGGIAVCSILMIIRSLSGASVRTLGEDMTGWRFSINAKRMFGGLMIFIAFLLIVNYVGYFTASALLIVSMARFAGYKNWPALIGATAGFCLFVYLVFVLLFDRPLPEEFFVSLLSVAN